MAFVVADRVKETSTTTGTGTFTLAGAVTGFQSFAAVGNGNTTYYCIASQSANEWEVGLGTYTSAGTTLARTTVLSSSNSGSLVNFSAGTKDVFVTYPSGYSVYSDGTRASGTWGISISGNAATATSATTATTATTATQVSNAVTFNNGGAGAASGTTFNGSAAQTISYNTLGAPSTTGTNASGTWSISINGNAATATNISNTGTVTLATATESNSIYVTAPSYSTDQPVKLLNFDWYSNVFSMGNIRSGSTPSNGFGFYYTASGGSRTEIARFDTSGYLTSYTSFRAPVFYDSNNTGYYVDPSSTSNLNGLTVAATISGSISGNAATASNASLLNSISAVNLFNNMGDAHGTRSSFDAQGATSTVNFGWRYVQGSTNGPGTNGASQYYSAFVGLGSDYAYNTYGMQIAIPRNVSSPYLSVRYEEGGAFGAWQKISAGYADSAGSAGAVDYNNLTNKTGGTGTYTTSGDYRAPIFYDSNNTGYYVDPASTSNLNGLTVAATISGSISGNAATATNASYAYNYTQSFNSNWNTDFQSVPAGSMQLRGDTSTGSSTGGPGGTWWFQENFRHTNGSNYWGVQIAWGWEDNANQLKTRNVTGGSFGSWVSYLNSNNYSGYSNFSGAVYGTIFYDANNTAYYVDPASTSNLNGLTVAATISGSISGNSATTNKVSTYDLRSTALTPSYFGQGLATAFMANSTDGLSDGGTYHGVIQFQQWSDSSGGGAAEIAITDNNNVWHRGSSGALTSWSTWYKFLDSGNYNSYAPTLTGTGASGTWSINVTGSAGSATTATTATNIAGGAANRIPYQTGAGATSFITAPSVSSTYLQWNGSAFTWAAAGGGAAAGGAVYENTQTISSNYTMTTNYNGVSAGPITISTGVTVTIPTGSSWSIV